MSEQHGQSRTPLYKTWQNIKNRCGNPNTPYFHNYGARGITMHPAWRDSFVAFRDAIGPRPSPGHTVERLRNEEGYIPGNIAWATRKEQAHNMRKNVRLTHCGRTQVLAAWAKEIGLVPSTLWYRIFTAGMPVDQALSIGRRGGRRPATGAVDDRVSC